MYVIPEIINPENGSKDPAKLGWLGDAEVYCEAVSGKGGLKELRAGSNGMRMKKMFLLFVAVICTGVNTIDTEQV